MFIMKMILFSVRCKLNFPIRCKYNARFKRTKKLSINCTVLPDTEKRFAQNIQSVHLCSTMFNLYDSSRECLGVPVLAFRNRQCKVCTACWYSDSGIAGPNFASCSALCTALLLRPIPTYKFTINYITLQILNILRLWAHRSAGILRVHCRILINQQI